MRYKCGKKIKVKFQLVPELWSIIDVPTAESKLAVLRKFPNFQKLNENAKGSL